MKRISLISLLILCSISLNSYAQTARIYALTADEWAQPRSGEVVASFSSLRSAVDYWHNTFSAMIMLRYPSDDAGELWAIELRDWLVALGVPMDAILMAPGLNVLDELQIVVGKQKDLNF